MKDNPNDFLESNDLELYDADQQFFEKTILTSIEAARLIKVSSRTLSRLVNERKIPFKRVGKQLRFSVDVLLDWVKEGG